MGDGWPFFSLLHLQLLEGSVAVMLAWPGHWGWHEPSTDMWHISLRATCCHLLLLCGGRAACSGLQGFRSAPVASGLPKPGLWLFKMMQEGTNPRLKGVVLCEGALTSVGGLVAELGWVCGCLQALGEAGAAVGLQRFLMGSVFPTGGLRALPHGTPVHRAAHGEAEAGII